MSQFFFIMKVILGWGKKKSKTVKLVPHGSRIQSYLMSENIDEISVYQFASDMWEL